jgi:FAD/FMN-containing dehydrogenase
MQAEYGKQMYANRLELFCKIRRQLDPQSRLLNPFLDQYFS